MTAGVIHAAVLGGAGLLACLAAWILERKSG